MLRDEEAIRHHLESRLLAVREQAFKAGDYLKNILQHKALG